MKRLLGNTFFKKCYEKRENYNTLRKTYNLLIIS